MYIPNFKFLSLENNTFDAIFIYPNKYRNTDLRKHIQKHSIDMLYVYVFLWRIRKYLHKTDLLIPYIQVYTRKLDVNKNKITHTGDHCKFSRPGKIRLFK